MKQEKLPFPELESSVKTYKTSFVNYEIYHDESIKDGYWHGMLLIPCEQKKSFYKLLQDERKKYQYDMKFSFKDIDSKGEKFYLADSWLCLAIGFLRSKLNKGKHIIGTRYEKKFGSYPYILSNNYLGAKFILFRVADNHQKMTYFKDKVCNIETTARMGLKGGLHFFGSEKNPIHIEKIHFDGHEHYLRDLDKDRIIKKINGLRSYCSFSEKDLFDTRSSNPKNDGSQDRIDCEFLLLTDLLIGSFRVALTKEENMYKRKLGRHAELILERLTKGPKRMKNSRWANSFWLSQCELIQNNWVFEELSIIKSKHKNPMQIYIEFLNKMFP
ncbi:MAG TPA: hypothetical protein PLR56_09330 [Brevefilum sp.]|nr:hypothetical protein [Brevefilum sp.]